MEIQQVKVLVTGSAGFIGSHLWRRLGQDPIVGRKVGIDLKSGRDCRDFFREDDEQFDLVFHCAATVGGREGIDHNAAYLGANNLQLDGAMFEWALRTRPGRVVYFSSAAAYPTKYQDGKYARSGVRMKEEHVGDGGLAGMPDESYGLAKWMGEQIAARVRNAGVPVTVVRPFSSYDFDQDDCYPFPEFVRRAKRRDDPFVVWGDGTQVRDWIHVDDLATAIFILVRKGVDGPVNLGNGRPTSMDDLARLCMATAGYSAPIEHLLDKPVGVQFRVSDNSRLLEHYTPRITLEQGVARALELTSV